MSERMHKEEELTPEWKELIEEGIKSVLEMYYGVPFEFTPDVLVDHDDERLVGKDKTPYIVNDFGSLSLYQQTLITEILFSKLNFNLLDAVAVNTQVVHVAASGVPKYPKGTNRPGLMKEVIYETNRSGEDLYLHIVTVSDTGQIDGLFIAPQDFVL